MRKYALVFFSSVLLFSNVYGNGDSTDLKKKPLKQALLKVLVGIVACTCVPLNMWHDGNIRASLLETVNQKLTVSTPESTVIDEKVKAVCTYLSERQPVADFGHLSLFVIGVAFILGGAEDLVKIAQENAKEKVSA